MNFYAGIGSRKTPEEVQNEMTRIALKLSSLDYCLRSGGADGADNAFERGAKRKEIYIPWDGFNTRNFEEDGVLLHDPHECDYFTQKFHPSPKQLSQAGKMLMGRNACQVFGISPCSYPRPIDFVVCWTQDGKSSGGTGQALRISKFYDIPIFNLFDGYAQINNYIRQLEFFSD